MHESIFFQVLPFAKQASDPLLLVKEQFVLFPKSKSQIPELKFLVPKAISLLTELSQLPFEGLLPGPQIVGALLLLLQFETFLAQLAVLFLEVGKNGLCGLCDLL